MLLLLGVIGVTGYFRLSSPNNFAHIILPCSAFHDFVGSGSNLDFGLASCDRLAGGLRNQRG